MQPQLLLLLQVLLLLDTIEMGIMVGGGELVSTARIRVCWIYIRYLEAIGYITISRDEQNLTTLGIT